jgi:uroporphyrinogen decarboxylase
LNSKERVLTAISHEEPDRIPKHSGFTPEISRSLRSIFGIEHKDTFELDFFLGHDMFIKEIGWGEVWEFIEKPDLPVNEMGIYYDDWGVGWKKVNYGNGTYIEMVHHPLSDDIQQIDRLSVPPISPEKYNELSTLIKRFGNDHIIIGGISATIFEPSWYLRGQQQFLIDMIENPDFADQLMKIMADYHLQIGKKMVTIGVDIIFLGDDVGTQNAPMISRSMYHKFLTPKYAKIIEELKKINKDLKFAYHCCGHIDHILPELVEAGVDIIQVMQPGSVDFAKVKKQFGKKISFWGGIDVQKLIPNATPKEVVYTVKSALNKLGKNGGYIIGMTHNVQPGPRAIDNTLVAYYAIEKYGYYTMNIN